MYEFTYYQVKDVMTLNPITVQSDTLLGEIEDIFNQRDFNGIPVVAEDGGLLGMVTKLDLLKAFDFNEKLKIPAYALIRQYPCEKIMTKDISSVRVESPLTRVLHHMIETRYKSFPVTEEGKLKGIIAREDILKALSRAAHGILPERLQDQNNKELEHETKRG